MQVELDNSIISYDYAPTESALPPLLFLHGALGVREHFAPLRKQFSERSQLAIDFPSHGQSTVLRGELNCERLARDTLALLDAIGIEQVDVIGHSMGGYVGMVLAQLAPQRVRSVVTLGTKFYWSAAAIETTMAELDGGQMRARSLRSYEALAAMHSASGLDETLRLTRSLIADFARWQLDEASVRGIEVPMLFSTGDRDSFVPPAELVRLFDTVESKRNAVAVLPNTPHPLQHLAVDCFSQCVRRFWERTFPAQP